MWKLSLVIIFFWEINHEHINHKIIVLDNCTKWNQAYISKEPGEFAIVNDFDYNNPVLLSNVAHLGSPMEVRTITLKDVINIKEYVSSSELSNEDWMKFEQEGIKVFVIRPDDYCSGKRFEYNHVFKLYEVRVQVTRDE